MLLGFGYLYKFVLIYLLFIFFFQKAEINRFKKTQLAKILLYYLFIFFCLK